MDPRTAGVEEGDERVVVDAALGSTDRDVGVDGLGPAEQHDGLVDDVRPEVVDDAGARPRPGVPLPRPLRSLGHAWLPALVARLERVQGAQGALAQEIDDGAEVTVPAPVLVGHDRGVVRLGQGGQAPCLRARRRDRLVDHHRAALSQHRVGDDRVRGVRRRHHHEIDVHQLVEEALDVREHSGLRVTGRHRGLPLRVGGDDRRQLEPGLGLDEGGVEVGAPQAEADQRHPGNVSLRIHGAPLRRKPVSATVLPSPVPMFARSGRRCGAVGEQSEVGRSGSVPDHADPQAGGCP